MLRCWGGLIAEGMQVFNVGLEVVQFTGIAKFVPSVECHLGGRMKSAANNKAVNIGSWAAAGVVL